MVSWESTGIPVRGDLKYARLYNMVKLSGKTLGQWGESIAADYLGQRGYSVIEQNARTAYGEIDLIARWENSTIFVEVKTRSSTRFGYPEEAITARKSKHLIESSQAYLMEHPELDGDWRIDVIAIQRLDPSEDPKIEHFENAVN